VAFARLGLEIRAGIHAGEIEILPGDVAGIAVHICARVAAAADPGEIRSTATVKDLVIGSELRFEFGVVEGAPDALLRVREPAASSEEGERFAGLELVAGVAAGDVVVVELGGGGHVELAEDLLERLDDLAGEAVALPRFPVAAVEQVDWVRDPDGFSLPDRVVFARVIHEGAPPFGGGVAGCEPRVPERLMAAILAEAPET
jgi:hypothetical protein